MLQLLGSDEIDSGAEAAPAQEDCQLHRNQVKLGVINRDGTQGVIGGPRVINDIGGGKKRQTNR